MMTTTIAKSDRACSISRRPSQHLLLENVSWSLYERFLLETAQQHLQITYDRGRMEIMSPPQTHENRKKILGMFVEIIALERDIAMSRLGSTTLRRKALKKGLEPDDCFYIANEALVRRKVKLDLNVDPGPDLAIEVDVTRRSIMREPIYAALAVAELWRDDGLKVVFRCLNREKREYFTSDSSVAFPFLLASDLNRFLSMLPSVAETTLLRSFRDWVRMGM